MPMPPTQAVPSNGGGEQPEGLGQAAYYSQGEYPLYIPRNNVYANNSVPGRNPVGGYAYPPLVPPASTAMQTPSAYINNANPLIAATNPGFGSMTNFFSNPPADDTSKPFSGYQVPSGYSPWMALYAPTANGTLFPYVSYVQPSVQQQNFNLHVNEQINSVQMQQRGYMGTPGIEVPMSGNGLVNPQIFLNYKGYYPEY